MKIELLTINLDPIGSLDNKVVMLEVKAVLVVELILETFSNPFLVKEQDPLVGHLALEDMVIKAFSKKARM
jgi:hypothetical protein